MGRDWPLGPFVLQCEKMGGLRYVTPFYESTFLAYFNFLIIFHLDFGDAKEDMEKKRLWALLLRKEMIPGCFRCCIYQKLY